MQGSRKTRRAILTTPLVLFSYLLFATPSVTEQTQLTLGSLLGIVGETCNLNAATEVRTGNACLDNSEPVLAGDFLLSDEKGTVLTLTLITHSPENNMTFEPQFSDGSQSKLVTLTETSTTFQVGGEVSFSSVPVTTGSTSIGYTIEFVAN